jgi:uncharacterized protein (TIGR03067 family)
MFRCKYLSVLALVLNLAAWAIAAADKELDKEELIKKDLEKLQGNWVLVSIKAFYKRPVLTRTIDCILKDGKCVQYKEEVKGWEATEKELPLSQVAENGRLIIKDKHYAFCMLYPIAGGHGIPEGKAEIEFPGTLALDPTRKPKTVDRKESRDGEIMLGIYEIEGDTLRVVTPLAPGGARPKQFTAPDLYASFVLSLTGPAGLMIITIPTDPYILGFESDVFAYLPGGAPHDYYLFTFRREPKK